ncbi:MAG: biphenyl 2,3-dioxygenase [Actinobacteria bacterium]|uniref:Unannotated protein n=1 Tax=freshwater metagenome TaxID=449393 RepID=A0A6J7JNX5_9ZZZZ|nr:biphenyl 2,3-dioxygenase [Actinomycetota bacterium]MSW41593.1 biphenyl 2,3-dioxygenase [Actinomycetota bacterium]
MATPKLAHIVFQTAQPQAMRDFYCTLLEAHVVYSDDNLSFMTYDDEHHRIALLHPPIPMDAKAPNTAAAHHIAFTFPTIDDLLERFESVRDEGLRPAVCIAHGVTTSMYYRDPDGNFVEMQIDRFAEPDDATAYMNGPEYAADSVGAQFDPDKMLADRRAGMSTEEIGDRAWAVAQGMPAPLPILMGAPA